MRTPTPIHELVGALIESAHAIRPLTIDEIDQLSALTAGTDNESYFRSYARAAKQFLNAANDARAILRGETPGNNSDLTEERKEIARLADDALFAYQSLMRAKKANKEPRPEIATAFTKAMAEMNELCTATGIDPNRATSGRPARIPDFVLFSDGWCINQEKY
jgi:hypothetical protein